MHLRVRELGEDVVLHRSHGDHPLPLVGAGASNLRPIFLDGHHQPEDDCRFLLVENGHNASAVDHRNLSIEHVRHVDGLPVDRSDSCCGDLFGKILFPVLSRKPLLRQACPVGYLIVLPRRPDMQYVWLQGRVEPPLILYVGITPSAKLCGSSCISSQLSRNRSATACWLADLSHSSLSGSARWGTTKKESYPRYLRIRLINFSR